MDLFLLSLAYFSSIFRRPVGRDFPWRRPSTHPQNNRQYTSPPRVLRLLDWSLSIRWQEGEEGNVVRFQSRGNFQFVTGFGIGHHQRAQAGWWWRRMVQEESSLFMDLIYSEIWFYHTNSGCPGFEDGLKRGDWDFWWWSSILGNAHGFLIHVARVAKQRFDRSWIRNQLMIFFALLSGKNNNFGFKMHSVVKMPCKNRHKWQKFKRKT